MEKAGQIIASRSLDRAGFVKAAFERFAPSLPEGTILVKPNVVSHEPYPTTTHPETLDAVLHLLAGKKFLVGDGAAADLIRPGKAIRDHALARVCQSHGLPLLDLYGRAMGKVKAPSGVELTISAEAVKADFMVSLPVLKTHKICMMTGAIKNHFGLLGRGQRGKLHFGRGDIHAAIASLLQVTPPALYIMDAIETMTVTNEVRHGGRPARLGCMLAGTDAAALDAAGLSMLGEIEPSLAGKKPGDVPYLRMAGEWGLGSLEPEIDWID